MNAQVMYDLLEFIKKERVNCEDRSIRLLKFIYSDVYSSLTENLSELDGSYHELMEDFQQGLIDYIDGDKDSILYYFKDLIFDGKMEFIDSFFKRIDTYFKMIDNHLYRDDDFIPYTFVFNIYGMLRSYSLYKDDFDKFNKSLEKYTALLDASAFKQEYYNSGEEFCLNFKKQIFDKLTSIVDFEEIPVLKDKFDICYTKICSTDEDSDSLESLVEDIDFVIRVVTDMRALKEKDPSFDEKNAFELIDNWFDYYSEDENYFYAPILLYKNRFDYIRDSYSEYIDQNEYMDEIMGVVHEFDNELFKYLDSVKNDGVDSFVTCMDIVFDSDTLEEVWKKVNVLKETSELFSLKPVPCQTVLEKIKSLSSDKYKKQINGQKVMFVNETANMVERPTSILDRMVKVYSSIYGISEDEVSYNIVDSYSYDETIVDFEDNVNSSLSDLMDEKARKALEESNNNMFDDISVTTDSDTVTMSNETHSNSDTKGIQKSFRRFFGKK